MSRCDTRSIIKWILTYLNSVFLLDWLPYQDLILPYYLSMPGGRIVGFIPSPRVLALYEIQTALFRI